jgi:phytoene desaturase
MAPRKKVVIVGGGPGGLCAAMLLAARGFEVTVLEKQRAVGGRSGALIVGDYTFDLGSTMLMMRFVVEEMFELAGRRLSNELQLVSLDPMYRLVFGERSLDVYANVARMEAELKRFAPGSEPGLQRFLEREHSRLERLYPVLQKSWPRLVSLFDPAVLAAIPHVGIARSLHETARHYFADEALQLGFSFQSAYLGMSPWECPGGFGMVPYVEHAWGLDYVRGGVHRLCLAMERVARELGATIRTQAEVQHLRVDGDRCTAAELKTGERFEADELILDADAAAALVRLLDQDVSLRFSKARLEHLRESCSTFMLYLGLDTQLPLRHHTFLFAHDYRAEMDRVFHRGELADDLSLYVCNPAQIDPSLAPPGHSPLYLLALVPNTRADIDWELEAPRMRARILAVLQRHTGVELEPHIRAQKIVTPSEWERQYQVSHGAVFGPAHSIDQLLAFRLPNQLPHPRNVFLTGGGTNPGSGLPTILESARLVTRLLCERHRVPFPASRPLPEPMTWQRVRGTAREVHV